MGCASSATVAELSEPVTVDERRQSVQDDSPETTALSLAQLGVEVPKIPGDIGLCGHLSVDVTRSLAPRYKSWVYLNSSEDKNFFRECIEQQGVQNVEVRPFPGPEPMPSDEQVTAALEALHTLPRPLMVQCTSGNRAGALLLLWLVKKHGYSPESAKQLGEDMDLRFWLRCARCGPMREWLMTKLSAPDFGHALKPMEGLTFSQLFDSETSTYTYLLGCLETKEALLIDPVLEQKDRDLALVRELGLTLRWVLNTHAHADHITSGGLIKKEMPEVKSVISKASGAKADWQVEPGERVSFGKFSLEAVPTPGHTDGCVTWLLPGSPSMVFTGDALLIRGCGRTDFQGGDAGKLYDSVHSKIFSLPGDTVVYPGHDYKGRNISTVDEEKKFNPRLTKTRDEFVKLMSELNLPYPKKIDVAVPANMLCGVQD